MKTELRSLAWPLTDPTELIPRLPPSLMSQVSNCSINTPGSTCSRGWTSPPYQAASVSPWGPAALFQQCCCSCPGFLFSASFSVLHPFVSVLCLLFMDQILQVPSLHRKPRVRFPLLQLLLQDKTTLPRALRLPSCTLSQKIQEGHMRGFWY